LGKLKWSDAVSKPRHVVVVGASLAGLNAVRAARELGFDGDLTLLGDEAHLPYDRPPLSKALLRADTAPELPSLITRSELERELGVTCRLGSPAQRLDSLGKRLRVAENEIAYDAAIIATGVRARTLPNLVDVDGVHRIRDYSDAIALRSSLECGERLVVIGGGFIGSEVAAVARERGLHVTIVEAFPTLFAHTLGTMVGVALADLHRRRGIYVETGFQVEALEGTKKVSEVRLAGGRRLAADIVVVAVGAQPATEWLMDSGLRLDNGIVCDAFLSTGLDGVWAAGDIARWPNAATGVEARIEHWDNAVNQGRHAMANALEPEAATPYRIVPYFWSDWGQDSLQFAGVATGEPQVVAGSLAEDNFVALYHDNEHFRGVLTLNRSSEIMKYRAMLNRGASTAEALAFATTRAKNSKIAISAA
jgi:NADPH-dependent 2,4-dienoyl-CoA reductase/sulfur reductase-like enzyme